MEDESTRRVKLADTEASPAARLRQVDHWHLTCWHTYRLLQDFYGNGELHDPGKQYFEVAADRSRTAARTARLPFRYEIPGQYVEDLEELGRRRVRAYQSGLVFAMAEAGRIAAGHQASAGRAAISGSDIPLREPQAILGD